MLKVVFFFFSMSFLFILSAQVKKNKTQPTKKTTPNKVITKKVEGHNITITLKPITNRKVFLGSYYGNGKIIVDSAMLNEKSQGVFTGPKKLVEGIYFVVSPNYSIQFELLIGNKQSFSVTADTAQKDNVSIIGSPDNDIFKAYSIGSYERGQAIFALEDKYKKALTLADSTSYKNQLNQSRIELEEYRNNIINKSPDALLAALLSAMKRPDAPQIPIINGKADSSYPYRFVKEHFWDDVLFSDERLLRTPFFERKIEDYYKYYVSPEPDSIIPEVKTMLISARSSKEMFAYLLTKFTNKYLSPEFMGQDKVFLYLFTDFYAKGDTTVLDAKSKKMIFERGYYMMANQLNNPAPILNLSDTLGNPRALYDFKNKFTFVAFWDPTCGHCKEEIPRIDSIYKAKWKELGVGVYSMNIKESYLKEWKAFLNEKNISKDWQHVYQTKAAKDEETAAGIPSFSQLYDVIKTPTFYLLDENKQIIGKGLSIQQFDDVIRVKLQKK